MAQVKVLKIGSEGVPSEHGSTDELSMYSLTAALAGGLNVTTGCSITNNISFNAVTDTIAGIQNQNLVDKTAAETITAEWSLGAGGIFNAANGEAVWPDTIDATPVAGSHYWDGDTLYGYDAVNSAWLALGGQGASASAVDKPFTADEALTAGNAVYISANDNVSKAKADSVNTDKVVGFALTTVDDTDPVMVRQLGIVEDVLTGATAGARYYLSKDTAGAVTASAPTGAGNRVIQVGFAKNATDLDIQFQFMGIRS